MRLDKRFTSQVARALEQISLPLAVLDAGGEVVYSTQEDAQEEILPQLAWEENLALMGGRVYLRMPNIKGLIVTLPQELPHAQDIARLAATLLGTLARQIDRDMDRDEVLRRVLLDGLDGTELETLALEHGLELEKERCVVLFQSPGDAAPIERALKELFSNSSADLVVDVGRNSIVLLRAMDHVHYEELQELVLAVEDTVREESGAPFYAGIGEPKESLGQMGRSLLEARRALEIGRIFRGNSHVYTYRSLLLERFIEEISPSIAERYYALLFNKKNARIFNEEMIETIDKFFECHLNVSEAARQLYIHRNTLVYRLDKVQRATGLDLRAFDDAITFKLLRMLGKRQDGQTVLGGVK